MTVFVKRASHITTQLVSALVVPLELSKVGGLGACMFNITLYVSHLLQYNHSSHDLFCFAQTSDIFEKHVPLGKK